MQVRDGVKRCNMSCGINQVNDASQKSCSILRVLGSPAHLPALGLVLLPTPSALTPCPPFVVQSLDTYRLTDGLQSTE